MSTIPIEKFRTVPYAHQIEGVRALVTNPFFAIYDEPRCGKSKQVVDAACILFEQRKVDLVVVVCPAYARGVWSDFEVGQIVKHRWHPVAVAELHKTMRQIWSDDRIELRNGSLDKRPYLGWIVTNYEALRNKERLGILTQIAAQCKTMLVCDESSNLFNRTAAQTKAVMKLRKVCSRAVILNGTPGSPLDQWSQMNVLSETILAKYFAKNYFFFRSEYCNLDNIRVNGRMINIVSKRQPYKHLDDLNKKTAPYVLRRLKEDCLDLPAKIGGIDSDSPVFREVSLTKASWERYKTLRSEAIVALGNGELQIEPNAGVRIIRLAQLTSGLLGRQGESEPSEVSSEKLDWCNDYIARETMAPFIIVWCRWRRERERLAAALNAINTRQVFQIYGSQPKAEREAAIRAFAAESNEPSGILIAQPAAGGFALDLPKATESIYLSNTRRLIERLQSEERNYGPAQKFEITVMDVLAVGPDGQKTIDRTIWDQLRRHRDISEMTSAQWRRELEAEF